MKQITVRLIQLLPKPPAADADQDYRERHEAGDSAVAHFMGSLLFITGYLGLAPQALCCRALRALCIAVVTASIEWYKAR